MTKVLEAAERMLEELGPEKTSIPAIAEMANVPRAAIYPFFPDKYALFSHLAVTHMTGLTHALAASGAARTRSWRTWIEAMIKAVAEYYNAHPVASILLLRESFTETDRAAHAAKNETLGERLRARTTDMGVLTQLPTEPDAATLAVEIAFACMKHGYAKEGRVSPAICREASRAMIAYLGSWESRD